MHDQEAYFFSLGMTFRGAVFFFLSHRRREAILQEAINGVVYAASAAASLIALDRTPGGAEHIHSLASIVCAFGFLFLLFTIVRMFRKRLMDKGQ